jgi:sulfofructose kinase
MRGPRQSPMTRVVCVGHAAMDSIYRVPTIPIEPIKVFATGYQQSGGGMAANASVAAARLGADAHYWGRVGDDTVGTSIVDQLRAERVNTETVLRMRGRASPTAAILISDNGERLICVYNDTSFDTDTSWLPLLSLRTFDIVLADVRWPEGSLATMRAARTLGVPTVLDGDIGDAAALASLAHVADYAIFSERGLTLASGTSDVGAGLLRIEQIAGGIVGVTLGPEGLLWREHGDERRSRAPTIDALDTLGAGDVFHAAFALAVAEGSDVAAAARFANAAAALKCRRIGGRLGAPFREEVDAFLRQESTQE